MLKLIVLFSFLILLSCNKQFIQEDCTSNEKSISIYFQNTSASRTIFIDLSSNTMTFKGTTLNDLKWATDLKKEDVFKIDLNNNLSFLKNNHRIQEFGVIDNQCKKMIQEKLSEFVDSE